MNKLNVLKNMGPMGPRGLGPIKKTEGRTGRKDRAEGPGGRTGRKDRAEGPGGRTDGTPPPHPPPKIRKNGAGPSRSLSWSF